MRSVTGVRNQRYVRSFAHWVVDEDSAGPGFDTVIRARWKVLRVIDAPKVVASQRVGGDCHMEIPDSLVCLFTAEADRRDGSVVIEIPESEIQTGAVSAGEVYQIALLPRSGQVLSTPESQASGADQPVKKGDVLEVEIEDIGDQGDGIARVGPGFVVIVPETVVGDRVTVEITDVSQTVAFGEVVDREHSVV